MRGGWITWTGRTSGILLVALALAMRAATPAGWMYADDAKGIAHLVICTGHVGGAHTLPGDPWPSGKGGSPCAFADAHHAMSPPPLIEVRFASYAAPAPPMHRLPGDQRPGLGLAAPPPPSLAPPTEA